jgi:transcriptional regulator with XRE-family HTH domain
LRHAKGLAQDDLAYEADASRSYLSQLEKGAFYARLKFVGKLAAVLEVEPGELLRLPRGVRVAASLTIDGPHVEGNTLPPRL